MPRMRRKSRRSALIGSLPVGARRAVGVHHLEKALLQRSGCGLQAVDADAAFHQLPVEGRDTVLVAPLGEGARGASPRLVRPRPVPRRGSRRALRRAAARSCTPMITRSPLAASPPPASSSIVPSAITTPSLSTATRSQSSSISARMWLETKTVLPWSASARSSRRMSRMPGGSRPLDGSSRISSSGSCSMARAMPSRWRMPSE